MSSTSPQSIPPGKIVLTYDDYCEIPNDRNRYEVLEGELNVTPAPSIKHQTAAGNLFMFLSPYISERALGKLFFAPVDLILEPTSVLQPDFLFVSSARQHIITEKAVEGAPDLVIEILSPSTSRIDHTTKAHIYAKHGVPHYWLVDPDQQNVEAYELVGDRYKLALKAENDEVFNPSLFPGLSIPLADLWS